MAMKNNYNHRVSGSFLALKTPQNLKVGRKLTDLTYFPLQFPSKLDLYSCFWYSVIIINLVCRHQAEHYSI